MRRLGLLVIAFFAITLSGWSQAVSTSQIKGTVRDSSGAAVPGATVTATQTDRGLVRTAVSGPDGSYVIPELPVGPYQLEATMAGFSKYLQTGIVLQVASNPTVDIVLNVGGISEEIVVAANASMVETQNTGVGNLIDAQRVVDLPLIVRQVIDLVILSGAATQGTDPFMLSGTTPARSNSRSPAGWAWEPPMCWTEPRITICTPTLAFRSLSLMLYRNSKWKPAPCQPSMGCTRRRRSMP